VLNAGFPKSALVNWAAATTAGFAVDHWDELTELTPSKRLAEHVLQIAACRYADFALDDAGVETPLPRIDATGVVILRADGYDLVPVEADERAFFVFRCVKWLAEFIDDREQWIGNALPPGVTA